MTTHSNVNRLIKEKSPYLLQHAHNPVEWFPFDDDAFEQAKKQNKPIFLSIGYATCHWCHVMEKESFEDAEVAALMNDAFISVKVDREERPDIDHIYMSVSQMMTGSGGWPLTVLLTPEKKPFFVATYIPKTAQYGRKGMMELIPEIKQLWTNERPRIDASANHIVNGLQSQLNMVPGEEPNEALFHRVFRSLKESYDPKFGGFGYGTKFPMPHQLLFLMRYFQRFDDEDAKKMVIHTLDAMADGGIYDHIGFGFHRYATDPDWQVPHFEKMLYDQALTQLAYIEAYRRFQHPNYRRIAEEIGVYIQRDMTAPQGGFYSAEDADSEGIEGKFYLWTIDEIKKTLGETDGAFVIDYFDMSPIGNFSRDSGLEGANILHRSPSNRSSSGFEEHFRDRLFQERSKRIHPFKDDKILTSWNGLMIASLATAGRVLNRPDFVESANRAADFIARKLVTKEGTLLHRYRDNEAGLAAHLNDYAAYAFGRLALYQAAPQISHLEKAYHTAKQMIRQFADPNNGAFFLTSKQSDPLLVRLKELYDGAEPSGNALAYIVLMQLFKLTRNVEFQAAATDIAKGTEPFLNKQITGHAMFMVGLDMAKVPGPELFLVGPEEHSLTQEMLTMAHTQSTLDLTISLKTPDNSTQWSEIAPFTTAYNMQNHLPTAYVCINQTCHPPTNDPTEMMRLITPATSTAQSIPPSNSPIPPSTSS